MISFSRLRNQSTERLNNLLSHTAEPGFAQEASSRRLCYQPLNSHFLSAENKKGKQPSAPDGDKVRAQDLRLAGRKDAPPGVQSP